MAAAPGGGGTRSIFVGNLAYQASEQEIADFFSDCGNVINVRIIVDRFTQRPKGFGFVEFDNEEAVDQAVRNKNNLDFMGRSLRVDYANSRNN